MSKAHSHEWEYQDSAIVGFDNNTDLVEGVASYRCACGETMTHHYTSIGLMPRTTYEFKVVLTIRGKDDQIDRPTLNLELCDLLAQHPRVAGTESPLLDTYPPPFRYKDSSNG